MRRIDKTTPYEIFAVSPYENEAADLEASIDVIYSQAPPSSIDTFA